MTYAEKAGSSGNFSNYYWEVTGSKLGQDNSVQSFT